MKPLHAEKGQGLMEYMLLLVIVSVASIAIISLLSPVISNSFSMVINRL